MADLFSKFLDILLNFPKIKILKDIQWLYQTIDLLSLEAAFEGDENKVPVYKSENPH